MKYFLKRSRLLLLLIILMAAGCKSNAVNPAYNPNELTLLIAASNDGEVGPCG
ncbi:MAG: hypothetical protein K9M55_06955 [Candidatus Marinimicrobia bacterium]|nr:hypothetical protein [Candidatus Neomarinimicrobiota bacterium]MCF7922421.1 hypothetical protein [Candidatus Neomarinimicrobiota bacterium]